MGRPAKNKGAKSELIKAIIKKSAITRKELAVYLGITEYYLDNKFSRNSFSFDDFVIVAYACDRKIGFLRDDVTFIDYVDPDDYFGNNSEVLKRLKDADKNKKKRIREEYEKKKAEIAVMKERYGFED